MSKITLPAGADPRYLRDIEQLARKLMAEYELDLYGWEFGWDRAHQRAGQCDYTNQRITLSAPVMAFWPWAEAEQTIRHEIAHALAGSGHGHDATWRRKCRLIGARPERCGEDHGEAAVIS